MIQQLSLQWIHNFRVFLMAIIDINVKLTMICSSITCFRNNRREYNIDIPRGLPDAGMN